jgi:thiol-disulfide isomerase/thioredoxin
MFENINQGRRRIIASSLVSIASGGTLLIAPVRAQEEKALAPVRLPDLGQLPSLNGATSWLNSPPLDTSGLRGKVVLIDVWTYTCINWLRTLPYVRAWADKYKEQGLVVVGVHSPEFEFEKNVDNIRWAIADMKIRHPIAVDSNFAIWRALRNQAWPSLYLADAQGRIRYRHAGEGQYARSERVVQRLLSEAGASGFDSNWVAADARGAEVAADWANLRSPETYVGYERAANFASPGGLLPDRRRTYVAPMKLGLNMWALAGDWTIKKQFASLEQPGGRISYRFSARDVHLVMGPMKRHTPVRFRVLVDERPPGADRGGDIDESGNGQLKEQRLYQLVRQGAPSRDRQFAIEFLDAGVEAYAFTFG